MRSHSKYFGTHLARLESKTRVCVKKRDYIKKKNYRTDKKRLYTADF